MLSQNYCTTYLAGLALSGNVRELIDVEPRPNGFCGDRLQPLRQGSLIRAEIPQGRPQALGMFCARIFTYHAEHGDQLGTLNSASTRVGAHSARPIVRFQNVIVTGTSSGDIRTAEQPLSSYGDVKSASQISLLEEPKTSQLPAQTWAIVSVLRALQGLRTSSHLTFRLEPAKYLARRGKVVGGLR
jgi:hypothetical protein